MDRNKLKDKIKSLSCLLEFNLNEQELEKIINEYEQIENSLQKISNLDIKDVEPTSFVHEINQENILHNDEVVEYEPKKVFKNAKSFKNNYVEIKNEK